MFGYGIKYLKDHLFGRVKRTLPETRDDDIRYVLTVPAIWNEGAKLFMKEAAKIVRLNQLKTIICTVYYIKIAFPFADNIHFTYNMLNEGRRLTLRASLILLEGICLF